MKNNQTIISIFFITAAIVSGSVIIMPQKVHAQWIVSDPAVEINTTLLVPTNTVSSVANAALQLKSFSLDTIATAIAKQILMQITLSVVKWINSGFKGSPAFVQNPAQFFENIGDQVAGNFLAANSSLAANLCSPFNIDVRVALALQISGSTGLSGGSQYSCSLSNMITNGTNAVKGATINGFTAGDFRQGGWPAFLALTTVPANNPNGAYLQAQASLSAKISNQKSVKQTQLAQGNGFLSWTTCAPDPNAANEDDDDNSDDSGQTCTVQTPGSAISGALTKSLNVPTENLELANDINAVINAAFSQLVIQVLSAGLSSVNSSNSSGAAYLAQIQNEQTTQLQNIQVSTESSISPYLNNATEVATNDQTALNTILATQNTLNNAVACYTNIINTTSSSIATSYSEGIAYAQDQINEINTVLTTKVAPLTAKLTTQYTADESTLQSMNNLENSISNTQDISGLTDPSQEIQSMANAGTLPSASNVLQSQQNLSSIQSEISPLQSAANAGLLQCQSFNPSMYNPETIQSINYE